MSILGRALENRAATSGLANPSPWLSEALTGGSTYVGRSVTVENSLGLVPVFSAVSLLANTIGSLPLMVYRRGSNNDRERAPDHRTWPMLHDQPNPDMAADEVWSLVATHLLLWGNAFLLKVRDRLDIVRELWPIRPNRVLVGWDDRGRYFIVASDKGINKFRDVDILHIRGLGTDGLVGLSPIQMARQMLAGAMEVEEFATRFWANSAYPGGVLEHPNKISDEAHKRLLSSWRQTHEGAKNANRAALLEEGMTWKSTGMPLGDAQFIESRNFNTMQIALLFRVPPGKLGAVMPKGSLTYTTTELEGIDLLTYSLRHWLVRMEGSLKRDPSIFTQGNRFFPEFLVDALMRSSTKERYDAYAVALSPQTGWMNRDEVRSLEGLKPDPDYVAPGATADPASTEDDDKTDPNNNSEEGTS